MKLDKETLIGVLDEHNWDLEAICQENVEQKEKIEKLEGDINDLDEQISDKDDEISDLESKLENCEARLKSD